jgi:hypothetical protein
VIRTFYLRAICLQSWLKMVRVCVVCNMKYCIQDKVTTFHKYIAIIIYTFLRSNVILQTRFRFPVEGHIMRKKWIRFVKKHGNKDWVPVPSNANNDSICSLHFSLDDFHDYLVGNLRLKHQAYPKIMKYEQENNNSVSHLFNNFYCLI